MAQGFAESFSPQDLFGLAQPFDKIVFSYALSIIPDWQGALDHALTLLKPGGSLYIVDFGTGDNLPRWFRKALFLWLRFFHVYAKPEILLHLKTLENGRLKIENLYGGYAYYAVFEKR